MMKWCNRRARPRWFRGSAVLRLLRCLKYVVIALMAILYLQLVWRSLANLIGWEEPPLLSLPDMASSGIDSFNLTSAGNTTPFAVHMPYVKKWQTHPHLIVCGILGTDDQVRRVMRNSQRLTWGTHPDVARKGNDFEGLFLLLYVQSLRYAEPPYVSERMLAEMSRWQDTLMLMMTTPMLLSNRAPGVGGLYGMPFQVLNSRKDLLFLRYVYQTFPDCPFIAKGDDDTSVYVPELMRLLRQLPRVSTTYGFLQDYKDRSYYWGHLFVVTSDLAREVATHPEAQELTARQFNRRLRKRYRKLKFFLEDLMIGYVLHDLYSSESPPRSAPALPSLSERLPPVEGWGKAYMSYLMNPTEDLRTGMATTADGLYNVGYHFPHLDRFKPGNILFIGDNCRVSPSFPMNGLSYGEVAQHYAVTIEQHMRVMEVLTAKDEQRLIPRPKNVTFLQGNSYSYRVQFMDVCPLAEREKVFRRRFLRFKVA